MPKTARCRSCDAPMLWASTPAGKLMPLDAEPVEHGNVAAHRDEDGNLWARALRVGEEPLEHEARYVTHFSSCPNGSLHRRGGSP